MSFELAWYLVLTLILQGGLQELKIYNNPDVAKIYCEASLQGIGSGENRGDVTVEEVDNNEEDFVLPPTNEGTYNEGPPPLIIPPPPDPGVHTVNVNPAIKANQGADDTSTEKNVPRLISGHVNSLPFKGQKGEPGERGSRGEKGDCVYLEKSESWTSEFGSGDDQVSPDSLSGYSFKNGSSCVCNISSKDILMIAAKHSIPGAKGDKGDMGMQGIPGIQGRKGESGLDGLPGASGPRGLPGPPGPPGIVSGHANPFEIDSGYGSGLYPSSGDGPFGPYIGRPGSPGNQGHPGLPGPPGIRGERGHLGDKGESGAKGDRGDKGDLGMPGHTGSKGDKGIDGKDGLPGTSGQKGESGVKGDRGPAGPPGLHDSGEWTFKQKGLKGDIGPRGTRGKVGKKGDKGIAGEVGIKGSRGAKGDRGPPGPPGQYPFNANQSDTHLLIKGEKGDRGKRGKLGLPGPVGDIGLPGFPGRSGSPGSPGIKGEPGLGFKGDKGEPGPPGFDRYMDSDGVSVISIGPKGDKGDLGAQGTQGLPGPLGPPGPPGLPGEKGAAGLPGLGTFEDGRISGSFIPVPGPPGPPGPKGLPGEGIPGPPGPPGIMGTNSPRQTSAFWTVNSNDIRGRGVQILAGPPGPPGPPGPSGLPGRPAVSNTAAADELKRPTVVPGAVTFKNMETLLRMSDISPLGTLAFLLEEESLLVKVSDGWQYVALGSLVIQSTPPPPKPTTNKPLSPPVESLRVDKAPRLRMAALNEPHNGDMHGVRGADYECYRQSRRANLRGTFRAFLASRVQNLDSIVRFHDAGLPVVNLKGEVVFNTWKDIFTGTSGSFPYPPRIYSFDGRNVLADNKWPQKLVWHGSDRHGVRNLEAYCNAWHSAGLAEVGMASSLLRGKLLDQERYSCSNSFIVLCIEATSQEDFKKRRKRTAVDDREEFRSDDYL